MLSLVNLYNFLNFVDNFDIQNYLTPGDLIPRCVPTPSLTKHDVYRNIYAIIIHIFSDNENHPTKKIYFNDIQNFDVRYKNIKLEYNYIYHLSIKLLKEINKLIVTNKILYFKIRKLEYNFI